MKRGNALRFLLLGLVSITAQVVIQRELINCFYGNELFIGIVLASWFIWTAIGSIYLGRHLKDPATAISLSGLLFFLEILLIRLLKYSAGSAGEVPDIVFGALSAFLSPAPLCLFLGAWWTSLAFFEQDADLGDAYLIELVGFVIGGVIFSFFLVKEQAFLVAAFVLMLCVIASLRNGVRAAVAAAIMAAFLFTPYPDRMNDATTGLRYKGQELIETRNTFYGNIAVTRLGGQYNFYEDGVPLGSTEKTQGVEDTAHLALLQHPHPESVMLVGGGFTGVIGEALKHPVAELYYLELDPELIGTASRYLTPALREGLNDPRVKVVSTDARYFLKNNDIRFDVIIINIPPPSTALLNRYYTKEFFGLAKTRLKDGGMFFNQLPFSPSAPSRAALDLSAANLRTLRDVFGDVLILPDENIIFIASLNGRPTYDASVVLQRFAERGLKNDYAIEGYVRYRLTTDRITSAMELISGDAGAKVNRDLFPVSYLYQNLFFIDHFYPSLTKALRFVTDHAPIFAAAVLLALLTVFRNRPPLVSMAAGGASLITLEMVIIFLYQMMVGYLYHRIALLISALMLGMALGVVIGKRAKDLYVLHIAMAAFCAVLLFLTGRSVTGLPIFICAVISGAIGAAIFPVANRVYLTGNKGAVYGADLVGSCLGALLPSLMMIPAMGVPWTLIFVGLMNLLVIPFVMFGLRTPVR